MVGGKDLQAEKLAARRVVAMPEDRDLVAKVAAQFMARHAKTWSPATLNQVKRVMTNEILPTFGDRRLSEIRRADVHELTDKIIDRGAAIYANRTLSWLKAMTNWAIEREIIEASPISTMKKKPTTETPRVRILSDSELRSLWLASDALPIQYSGFVKLLILTGQRRNEIAEMKWSELDIDRKLWILPAARAKNGIEHEIPLSDICIDIISSMPRFADGDFVFTLSGAGPIRGHHLIKKRIDKLLPPDNAPWVLHDIRRSVASGMAKLAISLPTIEKILKSRLGQLRRDHWRLSETFVRCGKDRCDADVVELCPNPGDRRTRERCRLHQIIGGYFHYAHVACTFVHYSVFAVDGFPHRPLSLSSHFA